MQAHRYMASCYSAWASEEFFPGGTRGFFQNLLGGAKSGEICFSRSKLRKQPFCLNFQNPGELPLRPLPTPMLQWRKYRFELGEKPSWIGNTSQHSGELRKLRNWEMTANTDVHVYSKIGNPWRCMAATFLTKFCNSITRQWPELERCSNHLRIRQDI